MSAQLPSTAKNLGRLSNTIVPLFVPSPATSTAPLLQGFVTAHDELMEDDSLFTHRADLATARVNLDAAGRELRKLDEAGEAHAENVKSGKVTEVDVKTLLSNIRKGRLRSRLQNQAAGPTVDVSTSGSGPATPAAPSEETEGSILREYAERRRAFDEEMAKAQEDALFEFKKNLREHMLAEARALS